MQKKEKLRIITFLREHHLAVISTVGFLGLAPESALIAFVEDEQLCLYFQTGKYTRKAANLVHARRVSLVIGLELKDMATLQYEGVAQKLMDLDQINDCKRRFLAKKSPTTREYLERPDAILFKITPTWIRFSDYTRGNHAFVTEIKEFA